MTELERLYLEDYNLWLERVKDAITNRDFANMDWRNLVEEIDDMGKLQKRSLESYLELLVAHILKLQYWESERERNYKHWKVEVVNFRNRINRLLKKNPSLKNYMAEVYADIFKDTVKAWKIEFHIPSDSFTELSKAMEEDYFG